MSSRVFSNRVERDIVIAQAPEAGSPLERGGSISMLISTGNKVPQYVMPALTGKKAEEALKIGLVTRLADDPVAAATETARVIAAQSPRAVRAAKALWNGTRCADLRAALQREEDAQRTLLGTPEQMEAVMAAMGQRPAVYED